MLLTRDLTPVLMDLGSVAPGRISVRTGRDAAFLQDTAAERCSMTYRPPELFVVTAGATITEKTDIWSLGCLLYALMFYKSPFDAVYERGDSVALAVQNRTVVFPDDKGSIGFSVQLKDLVLKLMNSDISFRPSIESVLEEVDEMVGVADQLVVQVT